MKTILLNPGPVSLSDRVRNAMMRIDLCHREPEFSTLQNRVRDNLLTVYKLPPEHWAAILLTGSGTAAVEAMLTSLVPDNGHVLIIENGVYGERMTRIAEIYGIPHTTLHHSWGDPIDLIAMENLLKQQNFTHVALVQHETTTGRLNDLETISGICNQNDVQMLIDGVSSFAAENINFTGWNIAACAATANKCLHGVPGISFVITRRQSMQTNHARTLYLDLYNYLQQQDAGGTPFTQSVQCLYALDEAIAEFMDEGGQAARFKKYWNHMNIIRAGMIKNGVAALMNANECSCVLQAFHLPANKTYTELHDQLKDAGFIIYAGQGNLSKKLFRVSAMGAITEDDMHRFANVIEGIVTGK